LKELVLSQAETIENLKEKLKINDKMLEIMNFKIEELTSSMNNQLSFNKRIETQIA
jgi:ribosomal protein S6